MGLVRKSAFNATIAMLSTTLTLPRSYPQLVGVRVALGAAEAGFFPGVTW